jgi:hypothetical protein
MWRSGCGGAEPGGGWLMTIREAASAVPPMPSRMGYSICIGGETFHHPPPAMFIFSLPTPAALAFLNAWEQQRQQDSQRPEWRDVCFCCGHQNSPLGPQGPSNRHGWGCGECGCC